MTHAELVLVDLLTTGFTQVSLNYNIILALVLNKKVELSTQLITKINIHNKYAVHVPTVDAFNCNMVMKNSVHLCHASNTVM